MLGRNLSALVTKMVRFVTEKAVAIEVLVDGSEPKLAAMFVSYLTHVARPLANSIDFTGIVPIEPRNQNRYVGEFAHLKTGVRLSHQTRRWLGAPFPPDFLPLWHSCGGFCAHLGDRSAR